MSEPQPCPCLSPGPCPCSLLNSAVELRGCDSRIQGFRRVGRRRDRVRRDKSRQLSLVRTHPTALDKEGDVDIVWHSSVSEEMVGGVLELH